MVIHIIINVPFLLDMFKHLLFKKEKADKGLSSFFGVKSIVILCLFLKGISRYLSTCVVNNLKIVMHYIVLTGVITYM